MVYLLPIVSILKLIYYANIIFRCLKKGKQIYDREMVHEFYNTEIAYYGLIRKKSTMVHYGVLHRYMYYNIVKSNVNPIY